ncbi:hypothetical protein G6M04_28765 [Agrobacterium rhizogenes]|nr:hypothetical protein [Rhizobium rhizogenes]
MLREHFVPLINLDLPTLEIGPFCAPVVSGSKVRYFDVMDQAALKQRAVSLKKSTEPPAIDYVSPLGDLSIINERFSNIVSAHCIEHQPDLVAHLQSISNLLYEDGAYFLIIPDKRYCFDHFIPESSYADVVCAHQERRKVHSLASVLEHYTLTTHNDPVRHWVGDHKNHGYDEGILAKASSALKKFEEANGGYIDVHAWQFTPASFREVTQKLYDLGLTRLIPERVYETPRKRLEFTAILRKAWGSI